MHSPGVTVVARPTALGSTNATETEGPPKRGNFLCASRSQTYRLSHPANTTFYSSHAWLISTEAFPNNLCIQRVSACFRLPFNAMSPVARGQSQFPPGTDKAHRGLGPTKAPGLTTAVLGVWPLKTEGWVPITRSPWLLRLGQTT